MIPIIYLRQYEFHKNVYLSILQKDVKWKIVSFGFPKMKYFLPWEFLESRQISKQNVEPLRVHSLPFPLSQSSSITEQIDGLSFTMFHYQGNWLLSTIENINDKSYIKDNNTVTDYFWFLWKKLELKYPLNTNYCYMFDLVSPYNDSIIKYDNDKIILHGAR